MSSDLALCLRNLCRQRVRSLIALSAILFAVVALLLSGGFIQWIFFAMREGVIESRLGHIQIARPGYFASGMADPFEYLLPQTSNELVAIEAFPNVRVVTARLAFGGLVSRGDTTVSFLGEGVDPEKETAIGRQFYITHGDQLSSEDKRGVIVGEGLAANLGAKPGDSMVLLGTTSSGGINAVEGRVRGIFYTSSKAYDDVFLRVPIGMAQELLRVQGAHAWIVLLKRTEETEAVLAQLKTRFPESQSRLIFKGWRELDDFYNKTVTLFSRQFDVVRVIIGLIIVLSISNTLMMSVLERTGEIGTLMAMGLKRKKILQLFVMEGLVLGVTGGFMGLIVGYALAQVISSVGIPMPPPPGMQRGFTGEIRITLALAASSFFIAAATSTIASLYPAWKASRLVIVDALRHNR